MNNKKEKVEEYFDKYAKIYNSGKYPSVMNTNPRSAMGFADDITWHFMLKYIPKNKDINILDAGAGDGDWTQKFIEQGYKHITLLDISEKMLDEAKNRLSKLVEKFEAQYIKGNIIDMKELESNMFDYVFSQYDAVSFCLKPKLAIKELARVVKEHGYVSVTLDTKFRRVPEYIESNYIEEAKILLNTNISNEFDFPQYNLEWEELAECFEAANLEVIEVVGAPVFMHQIKPEILQKLETNPQTRNELLKLELEHCTNRSLVNFAGHLQMIGKK
ncbi:MAG: methyltransferase domain-containing protein [Promethearchaeota archaeon]|jgi:ubiquinone/menaquinone biosynthesis C-methylase UbiE